MSALNDLITGAFLGKVVVGTVDKAVLELAELYREIDRYDKICTDVRNQLTAAGIPELTEDKLTVLPLAKRVEMLVADNENLMASLYKEAVRTEEGFTLIEKVLSADETDRWDALDMEPFVKWIENFPKEKLNGQESMEEK
jgi:hypothetical protein